MVNHLALLDLKLLQVRPDPRNTPTITAETPSGPFHHKHRIT